MSVSWPCGDRATPALWGDTQDSSWFLDRPAGDLGAGPAASVRASWLGTAIARAGRRQDLAETRSEYSRRRGRAGEGCSRARGGGRRAAGAGPLMDLRSGGYPAGTSGRRLVAAGAPLPLTDDREHGPAGAEGHCPRGSNAPPGAGHERRNWVPRRQSLPGGGGPGERCGYPALRLRQAPALTRPRPSRARVPGTGAWAACLYV